MRSKTKKRLMDLLLARGTAAPDFNLHVTPDQKLSLRDLRGRPVILDFYPADWSPVCGDQMALCNEILSEFHKFGAELLGFRSTACAAMRRLQKTATCISPCLPILNQKARSPNPTALIARRTASASVRCS